MSQSSSPTRNSTEDAEFELAISATKFGKFNVCLFLLLIPSTWTITFEVTSMSYVFPAAECHLGLSIHDKGLLNGSAYCGGFLWGFLCDTLGRKNIMVVTYLLDALMVVISGLSQSLLMLLSLKFLGGFFASGAFAAFASYILEFHPAKYRSKVQMGKGIVISLGTVALPLLAWAIMSSDIHIHHSHSFVLHSWNFYLFVCALPSIFSVIFYIFMPESPKFLMTTGRNKEALNVFQKIYTFNTGKSKEEFPIKSLIEESSLVDRKHGGYVTPNRTKKQALKEGCQQIRPMCYPPYNKHLILICTIQSLNMFSIQSIRLWLPQIFQSISDYQNQNNGTTSSLCNMLKMINPPQSSMCKFHFSSSVYIHTMIIATVSISNYIIIALLINKLGKKCLISTSCLVCGVLGSSLYFAKNTYTVLALSSLFISFGSVALNIMIVLIVDLFPTTQRSVAISITMVLGRLAAMLGNIVFPFLLKAGCAPPFFVVGALILISSGLSLLLPKTDLKPLE